MRFMWWVNAEYYLMYKSSRMESILLPKLFWCHFVPLLKQESLANAKVNTRQHCVSLSCLCNSLTQIEWVADFSLGDEDSENIASERYENRHLRRTLSCLTPYISRTPVNICITLISLETTFTRLHFRR